MHPDLKNCTVAIIGLGYVGLPLAVEFSVKQKSKKHSYTLNRKVIGYDINSKRIKQLREGIDLTGELSREKLLSVKNLFLTDNPNYLSEADVFIITVPTPIDENKNPYLKYIEDASNIVGNAISQRIKNKQTIPIVIYESTVFPGATEEVCVPIINRVIKSIKKFNDNFTFGYGYSPERINPGDNKYNLNNVVKVTSGDNPKTSKWIDDLYGSIISAGTYRAKSIKIAEAAKVIENTQRDLNIALVNEFAIIFKKMNIDTLDILETARTKWNFLDFKPGLVGGHCIGVDPYYLTNKSLSLGYYPELVLAGRRINENMSTYIVKELVFEMSKRGLSMDHKNILILGLTFKANCPDIRNTQVIKIIKELKIFNSKCYVYDPIANHEEAKKIYNLDLKKELRHDNYYDIVIAAVDHDIFKNMSLNEWTKLTHNNSIYFDLKGIMPRKMMALRI